MFYTPALKNEMKIKYIHSHVNDPAGKPYTCDIDEFILGLPSIGVTIKKSKFIPPMSVINEVLLQGKNDAGMSGYFEWTPLTLDDSEYEEVKNSLIEKLGHDYTVSYDENIALKNWLSVARKHFSRGQENDSSSI